MSYLWIALTALGFAQRSKQVQIRRHSICYAPQSFVARHLQLQEETQCSTVCAFYLLPLASSKYRLLCRFARGLQGSLNVGLARQFS